MTKSTRPVTILMADDDPDDRELTREAFVESHLANDLRFVEDGEELLEYLHRRGKYAAPGADPWFRGIRVVIMTTSKAEEDVVRSYDLSAASYITKPVTFDRLVEVVKALGKYWLEIVELP